MNRCKYCKADCALRGEENLKECKGYIHMSNADRIRSMSDDELNDLFNEIYNAGAEDAVAYECGQRTNSFEWTMEWLQQPAEPPKEEGT